MEAVGLLSGSKLVTKKNFEGDSITCTQVTLEFVNKKLSNEDILFINTNFNRALKITFAATWQNPKTDAAGQTTIEDAIRNTDDQEAMAPAPDRVIYVAVFHPKNANEIWNELREAGGEDADIWAALVQLIGQDGFSDSIIYGGKKIAWVAQTVMATMPAILTPVVGFAFTEGDTTSISISGVDLVHAVRRILEIPEPKEHTADLFSTLSFGDKLRYDQPEGESLIIVVTSPDESREAWLASGIVDCCDKETGEVHRLTADEVNICCSYRLEVPAEAGEDDDEDDSRPAEYADSDGNVHYVATCNDEGDSFAIFFRTPDGTHRMLDELDCFGCHSEAQEWLDEFAKEHNLTRVDSEMGEPITHVVFGAAEETCECAHEAENADTSESVETGAESESAGSGHCDVDSTHIAKAPTEQMLLSDVRGTLHGMSVAYPNNDGLFKLWITQHGRTALQGTDSEETVEMLLEMWYPTNGEEASANENAEPQGQTEEENADASESVEADEVSTDAEHNNDAGSDECLPTGEDNARPVHPVSELGGVPEVGLQGTDTRGVAYLDSSDQKPIIVAAGIGDKQYGSFKIKASGALKRVIAAVMPMVDTFEEAQHNLDIWARHHNLTAISMAEALGDQPQAPPSTQDGPVDADGNLQASPGLLFERIKHKRALVHYIVADVDTDGIHLDPVADGTPLVITAAQLGEYELAPIGNEEPAATAEAVA